MKGAICAFKTGIVKLNQLIWPAAELPGAPDTTTNVVDMLRVAPRRVDLLLNFAVRTGAQTALMMVKSWYPGLDLKILTGLRTSSDADVSAAWVDICHRAGEISSYVNPLEYTPYLDAEGAPVPAAAFSNLVHSSSNSDADPPSGRRHPVDLVVVLW